jgi:hypothetical protein
MAVTKVKKGEKRVVEIKVGVADKDLAALRETAAELGKTALQVEAAAKAIAANKDPNEHQLHRRVCVAVYDSQGIRISNSSFDLDVEDALSVSVDANEVRGSVQSRTR